VGLICTLGYLLIKSPRKGAAIAVAVLIGALLLIVAGPSYWNEMQTITDATEGTVDLRLELWQIATREFLAYPLTGVGGGNFHWRIHEFQSDEQMEKFDRILAAEVHSTYFQLLAETGLAGCIAFGIMMFRTFLNQTEIERVSRLQLASPDKHVQDEYRWMQNYGRGLIGGLVGYSASVAFVSALYYSHLWLTISLMASLHIVMRKRTRA
jgi:O-antigen ligase